jgi:hypothetical protein
MSDISLVNNMARLRLPALFNSLMEGLFTAVRAAADLNIVDMWPLETPLIKLLWRRLRRMSRQFHSILARYHAGTLPKPGSTPSRPAKPRPARTPQPWNPEDGPTPQQQAARYGALLHLTYGATIGYYDLSEMLADPETEHMVAEAPQLGRVLRPLCRMLALKPPPWLRLPRRARPRVAKQHPPAPDWLLNEPGAMLYPDGSVWMRLGASTHWPNLRSWDTLEDAQKFDRPVKIWPR